MREIWRACATWPPTRASSSSRGDIADADFAARLFADYRPTWVVNFAAESHVDRSIDGPRAFVETNIVGTFELLDAARRYLAERRRRAAFRFLHVSTDEVYGSLGPSGAFSETTPYAPNSPYAASKAAADHLVRAYRETYGLPALITNCSNNYGPYQFPEKLIPLMILNAIEAQAAADLRRRRQRPRLAVRRGPLRRHPARCWSAARWAASTTSAATTNAPICEIVDQLCATLEELAPAAENPALRGRGLGRYAALKTFVTDRPGHDRRYAIDAGTDRPRARLAAAPRLRLGPARHGALVPRQPRLVRGRAARRGCAASASDRRTLAAAKSRGRSSGHA